MAKISPKSRGIWSSHPRKSDPTKSPWKVPGLGSPRLERDKGSQGTLLRSLLPVCPGMGSGRSWNGIREIPEGDQGDPGMGSGRSWKGIREIPERDQGDPDQGDPGKKSEESWKGIEEILERKILERAQGDPGKE